ncbi:GTP pyrophosphokinase [Mariniluteicoccus flavus]
MPRSEDSIPQSRPDQLHEVRGFQLFMLEYKFGLDEVMTKVNILREELAFGPGENPIEHVSARLKQPESLLRKTRRLGIDNTLENWAEHVPDLAGIRIVCSFISDVWIVRDMILQQPDVELVEEKDYITHPKPNGYRSLHLHVRTPVHLSDGTRMVQVEIQIRTVAMDFWAALEHKIHYKWDAEVPDTLTEELTRAAEISARLDRKMQALHQETHPDLG